MLDIVLDILANIASTVNYMEYKETGYCDDYFKKDVEYRERINHNYQPGEVDYPAITSGFMRRR